MKVLKVIQGLGLILAGIIFLWAVLTGFGVLPEGSLILTIGGLQRVTDTILLFSIGVGLFIIVWGKK